MFIFIPAPLVAILTFPGIILHELAHKLCCDYFSVPVLSVEYFKLADNRAGQVIHQRIFDADQDALISLAPLFLNSLICCLLFIPYASVLFLGTSFLYVFSLADIFLIWVAIACGISAVPSKVDVQNISQDASGIYLFAKSMVTLLNAIDFFGGVLWTLFLFGATYSLVAVLLSLF